MSKREGGGGEGGIKLLPGPVAHDVTCWFLFPLFTFCISRSFRITVIACRKIAVLLCFVGIVVYHTTLHRATARCFEP